jgi:hypothetical protein
LDLDACHDHVTDFEQLLRARRVDAFAVVGATFFDKQSEDRSREDRLGLGKAEKAVEVGKGGVNGRGGSRVEVDIEGKFEGTADGCNTADDVRAIDAAAVPGVGGTMGGFHEDGVRFSVVGVDGDCLGQEPEEPFDRNSLVVAAAG